MTRQRRCDTLWQTLKHAFAMPDQDAPSPEEERWLERIADRVVQRGLAAPAVFLLQSVQPLSFVGSQVVAFFAPIASLVLPAQACEKAVQMLARRDAAQTLLRMIEDADRRQHKED